jgi:hypothetical protein
LENKRDLKIVAVITTMLPPLTLTPKMIRPRPGGFPKPGAPAAPDELSLRRSEERVAFDSIVIELSGVADPRLPSEQLDDGTAWYSTESRYCLCICDSGMMEHSVRTL